VKKFISQAIRASKWRTPKQQTGDRQSSKQVNIQKQKATARTSQHEIWNSI